MATYPDATNTGVPSGTNLTAYTGPMTITQDGTVIDGKIINGSLRVDADNVVIKNSQVNFNGIWGIDAEGSNNFTIQDSTITGPGTAGNTTSAILGSGTFLRNNISKSENGIQLVSGASVVKGNYIHDLQDGDPGAHYDGISVQGNQHNVLIEGNTILARDTSDVFIKNDFGSISDVTVRGNYLGGNPGYNIYVDGRGPVGQITGVTIEDNYLVKGFYGYYSVDNSSPTISGNTEATVPPPAGGNTGTDAPPPPSGSDGGNTGTDVPPPPSGSDDGGSTGGGSNGGDGSDGGTVGGVKVFNGTNGNDSLPAAGQSNAGNEKFYGRGGDDVLRGGAGADHLDGGAGNDTASYAGSNSTVNVKLESGTASGGHAAGDTLVGIENLIGSSHNDFLRGDKGANVLDGGTGADYMEGKGGNDTYIVDNLGDTTLENSGTGSGYDTVRSSISWTLRSNIEELVLTGKGNLNGTGNTSNNVLHGNSGNNVLNGHNGNDVLYGGLGNDVLTGGYQKDTFVFDTALNAATNVDRITDFSVVDDTIQLDHTVFAAVGASLTAGEFVKNTTGLAQDRDDRIIYESDTGKLFYDSNGSAAGGSVHFATLQSNLALTFADFHVI